MAKFLFVVPPFWGHINPTLNLGSALHASGHTVAWASMIPIDHLTPKEAKCYLFHEEEGESDLNEAYFESIKKGGQKLFGMQSINYLYEKVLIPMGRYMASYLHATIQDFKPDVIINDHQAFAGAIYAKKYNIPYITTITAPVTIKISSDFPQFINWENNQIIKLQKELGLDIDTAVASSELLSLVFSSKEFLNIPEIKENYKFVGPLIKNRPTAAKFDRELLKNSENPKVLISIGTVFSSTSKEDFFQKVVEAFGDKNYTIILVADPDLFSVWPDNFIVKSSVPQLELLPYMDAVICHGGHNTVCESLVHGIPIIVLPIAFDQFQVAAAVTDLGCGIRLKFKRLKPDHLTVALEKVLSSDIYKNAALSIGNSFKKTGGISRAITAIEDVLSVATIS